LLVRWSRPDIVTSGPVQCRAFFKTHDMDANVFKQEDERWKDIPNSQHQVSSFGRVKHRKSDKCLFISVREDRDGYRYVAFRVDGNKNKKNHLLNRLVLKIFDPIKDDHLYDVHHKDEDVANNRLDNLEWVLRSEHKKMHVAQFKKFSFILGRLIRKYGEEVVFKKLVSMGDAVDDSD
jgi:hypothetical protein